MISHISLKYLSNVYYDFSLSFMFFPLSFLMISCFLIIICLLMMSSLIPCYPPCFFHCLPIVLLDLYGLLMLSAIMILMMIVIKSDLPCFPLSSACSHQLRWCLCPPIDFLLDPMLSSLLIMSISCFFMFSHIIPCYPPILPRFPPWSLCSSPVIFLDLYVLLMFPSLWSWWWSRLNLSDDVLPLLSSARWWCFLPVLSLWSDYRGWLLIIFISNILLWWSLFLSF